MLPSRETPCTIKPASAKPHQRTLRCSKGRRLPPAMNPTQTAKPMTMRTNITWGSLRLGRRVRLHRSTAPRGSPASSRRYPCPVSHDEGYFGPDSVSWQVHREVTVLFGGARAMLMQAAHPLVIAGANQTGMYERNPWTRLQRTLVLQYALTFGTRAEAHAAADRINAVHERINGVDRVTGLRYDALDPGLLLWVHACLVDSALLFERLTVGRLDDDGRERFHQEQMVVAEMLGLSPDRIPPTVPELRAYIDAKVASGDLQVTDAARDFVTLFRHPPKEATWRPVLRLVVAWAFATLPQPLAEQYGVRPNLARIAGARASLGALRVLRPALPRRVRRILPALEAGERVQPQS